MSALKSILEQGLDWKPLIEKDKEEYILPHTNIRGAGEFSVTEGEKS